MSESDKPAEASFLSRWSRRKVEIAAQDRAVVPAEPVPMPTSSTGADAGAKVPETPHPEPTLAVGSPVRPELPSIDSLTHEADFSPFMAREVDPGLRNQAMKKLFTDPHYQFGQMDKLDIYIDDYSQPDPIPLEMLRKMHQARSLFLFDEDEKAVPQQPDALPDRAGGTTPSVSEPVKAADAKVVAPERVVSAEESTGKAAAAESDAGRDVGLAGLSSAGKSASLSTVEQKPQ